MQNTIQEYRDLTFQKLLVQLITNERLKIRYIGIILQFYKIIRMIPEISVNNSSWNENLLK